MIAWLRQHPLVVAVLGGLLLAATVLVAASLVARPVRYSARLMAVEEAGARLQAQSAGLAPPADADAVLCTTEAAEARRVLGDRLQAAATTAGIRLAEVRPREAPDGQVAFSVKTTGSYAGTLQFLNSLERGAPTIFVRTLEIAHTDGGVAVDLAGAVLCAR